MSARFVFLRPPSPTAGRNPPRMESLGFGG